MLAGVDTMSASWFDVFENRAELICCHTGLGHGVFTILGKAQAADARSLPGELQAPRSQATRLWMNSWESGYLRMKPDGIVDMSSKQGFWETFEVVGDGSPCEFRLASLANQDAGLLLGAGEDGRLVCTNATDPYGLWKLELVHGQPVSQQEEIQPTGIEAAAWENFFGKPWRLVSSRSQTAHGVFTISKAAVQEAYQNKHVYIWLQSPMGTNLRMLPSGLIDSSGFSGARDPLATFQVLSEGSRIDILRILEGSGDASTLQFRLLSLGNRTEDWYLAINESGSVFVSSTDATSLSSLWHLEPAAVMPSGEPQWSTDHVSWDHQFQEHVLTVEQAQHFWDHGYLHLPNLVSADLLDGALRSINAALCSPDGVHTDDDGHLHLSSGITRSDSILNLLYASPVWTLAKQLIGADKTSRPQRGQVALVPPHLHLSDRELDSHIPSNGWHIDGHSTTRHSPFTLLVGITLSAANAPNSGNFCVFPGSHHKILPLVREQVLAGQPVFKHSKPEFDNGLQILATPGDVVFAHHKLAHRAGPNASPHIRYQVYFRFTHVSHSAYVQRGQLLDDLWLEFEGVRELLQRQ